MKRLSRLDSVGGLISICPTPTTATDEQSPRGYGREFQSMMEGFEEETSILDEYSGNGHLVGMSLSEKKRRLSVDQVKALEKNFELENKLEPERKVKLAQELGLQPRQVAVWFQNRRARWKTKQLEKDYGVLKAQYDSLRLNFDSLQRDNDNLLLEIKNLKRMLSGEEGNNATESDISVKEEEISIPERNKKTLEQIEPPSPPQLLEHPADLNYPSFTDLRDLLPNATAAADVGSSDSSDSSAVLNDAGSPNATVAPVAVSSCVFQFVKMEEMEEHDSFEETCGFFSDEQPPSLHWYSAADHWT